MRSALAPLIAVALLVGCAAKRPAPAPPPPSAAEALVTQAQQAAAQGKPEEARKLYLEVLREHPKDPAAFDARYGMARLRLDPKSPLRDYKLALVNFDLLVRNYGKDGGDWLPEVESWRAVLKRLGYCEAKGKKLAQDVDRLREVESNMDQMRELDLELEVGK